MKLFNTIWTILLKSINGESPSISEVMKINSMVSEIISHQTTDRVCQLYELLDKSLQEFFVKVLKTFESFSPNKILASYLTFVQTLSHLRKMMKTLLYPIYITIPMIRSQKFSSFPTPEQIFLNGLRNYFYTPLVSQLDPNINKEMDYYILSNTELSKKAELKLTQFYTSLWDMASCSSYISQEDNKTQEILKYCTFVLNHFNNLENNFVVIHHYCEKTVPLSVREDVEKVLYAKVFDQDSLEKFTSTFIQHFTSNFEQVQTTYHASKTIGLSTKFDEVLKEFLENDFKEKEEKQIVVNYLYWKKFIQTHYPEVSDFNSNLKNVLNNLLSKGFGVKTVAAELMKDDKTNVAMELYKICEIKDSIHTSLISFIGVALVNGKTIPHQFLQSINPSTGGSFIYRTKRMIADSKESSELSRQFMETTYYQCLHTSMQVNVLIGTNHIWPLTFVSVPPLEALKPIIVMFVGFYHKKYIKRMLRFLHKSSIYNIQFNGCNGIHTLNHNQAVALIMASEGNLTEEEFKNKVVGGEGVISFLKKMNLIDTNNKIIPIQEDINISTHKVISKQKIKEELLIKDTSLAIQSKIVRTMKRAKSATKKQIISMIQSDDLVIDSKIIQPYLDEMVIKEYLEYDSNKDIYTYIS
ncbi:hypothetical protein EDI_165630 [Entamoeba dispar SAW760]|uniref:Cullin family profile domain-containing protein n=1 Tax=Entamoeba dispar (strain ATCC PRA-260 / SAW760) TaxID=370354 RepID=B0EJH9_ENTDS|nr:uncharacterized protein EDI_165630 [Entamoeba dispar SAW760]EDR25301.1 hypothetical protein EDI_165630 [Entamoeba dispar SAW760]|eukprot:EDR25301.1 hypothetical protein EDI_165630 [Entamoeba dispar SAW760]